MKREAKQEWVAALRSGAYAQIRGRLKGKEGYCCLGVLSEICAAKGHGTWSVRGVFTHAIKPRAGADKEHYQDATLLPASLANWLDLETDGTLPFKVRKSATNNELEPTTYSLAQANDDGCSFSQIADLIEFFF